MTTTFRPPPKLLFPAILAGVIVLALLIIGPGLKPGPIVLPVTIRPPGLPEIELNTTHPFEGHSPASVKAVRDCISTKGASMIMRSHDKGRFLLLCSSNNIDHWLIMVVEKIRDGLYQEITSYPADKFLFKLAAIRQTLERLGATRFKGPLP
jgi:hypothetical protein